MSGKLQAMQLLRPPFLDRVFRRPDRAPPDVSQFPFCLPFVANLDLRLRRPVVFFVGENGSGKSTLLEAIATVAGLPTAGGGRNELGNAYTPESESPLSAFLRPSFRGKPTDGYFLRAEYQAHFAQLLNHRHADPDFRGDPYGRYGGRSLLTQSHGEAFLAVIKGFAQGLFLLDEPEAALSPQRQLALMAHMLRLTRTGRAQFIVATHSPILMTFPDSQIVDFNVPELPDTTLEQTAHYQVTTGILNHPQRYWKHLADAESSGDTEL
jgi:predicted ATPase